MDEAIVARNENYEAMENEKRKDKRKNRLLKEAEDPASQVRRKKAGGFRGQEFSEGWVEFSDKKVAKRVAKMLNGEQIGGRKRSSFYYDLWNIKYLSKFKWDDRTEEIAFRVAKSPPERAITNYDVK